MGSRGRLAQTDKTLTGCWNSQVPCGFAPNVNRPVLLSRVCRGGFPWAFEVRRAASGRFYRSMADRHHS